MSEEQLRQWINQVRSGQWSRREFVDRLLGLGVGVPVAGMLLMNAGIAMGQPAFQYEPARRGGGGTVRLMRTDAPTLLNPHFGTGLKDNWASRIFYEPLAMWDADANLVPVLAAAIPSRENGGLAADGRSVVWTLKKGVSWHDGAPFTADDVIFNWQYAIDPAAATVTTGNYEHLKIEKIDSHTVRIVFDRATPFWPGLYASTMLVPKHRFAAYAGARSREAPENLRPVGTGPYQILDFRPADSLLAQLYSGYHQPNRPHFDRIEFKGGGDGVSAARAVLQTGEYDMVAGLVADDEVLRHMEAAGKGRVEFAFGSSTTAIYLNATDPAQEVDGERSHARTRHPLWSDPALRRAFALLIDRAAIQQHVFGRQAVATGNWINNPPRYRSATITTEFSVEKARQLLDGAGWKPGPDGVRIKDGRKLSVLFQGGAGGVTEKVMAIIKSSAEKAGFKLDLKVVPASVFFSSDVGNPDIYGKFNADIQIYNWTSNIPDPLALTQSFVSWEVSSRANKWLGSNLVRWQSAEFDAAYRAAEVELDPVKRTALFVRMNELIAESGYAIPILARSSVRAVNARLRLPLSPWQLDTASLSDWYRKT
jgi:peptide/nickel transport system substrate-binding protein